MTDQLQAVSVPVIVGNVSRRVDGSYGIRCTTSREFAVDETIELQRLQGHECEMLLQPEGLATVSEPDPQPKKKRAATPSQVQRMLIDQIWEVGSGDGFCIPEEYYLNRMRQIANELQLELEKLRQKTE